MSAECRQELCPWWDGDGRSCPCATFDLEQLDGCSCGDPDCRLNEAGA